MNPDDYEKTVAEIATGIHASVASLHAFKLDSGRVNRLEGASTFRHQIDVSLIGPSEIYLLECKRWEKKIGVDEVMILVARANDILQSREGINVIPILISKKGATRGAAKLARYFGVEIEIVTSALEYGLKLGKHAVVGLHAALAMTDTAIPEVYRNGIKID